MYDAELLERNLHPANRWRMPDAEIQRTVVNASCGDELVIYLEMRGGRVVNGAWEGSACAVSQAAADLFIDMARGYTIKELRRTSWQDVPELECVKRMPARAKCAELPWKALGETLTTMGGFGTAP